jgi:hypothetical protein
VDARYAALLDEIRKEIPGFRIVRKDRSPLHRAIHQALRVLTFGAQSRYLTGYQTTIGKTVYVTADWDDLPAAQRYITMRHERVHLQQFRRYSLPVMAFLYLLVPFPVGIAYFRARFEQAGYEESVRAAAEVHGYAYVASPSYRAYVLGQFTSGAYGWMWPFPGSLDRWYERLLATLR